MCGNGTESVAGNGTDSARESGALQCSRAIASSSDGDYMELDMELEAEVDSQAFGKELRAIKVRIDDSNNFVLSKTVPWCDDPQQAMAGVKAVLEAKEPCYILFRTATWALMSFIPSDAPGTECVRYSSACEKLQELLGGPQRVPNVRRWTTIADAKLDEEVELAPPMSYMSGGGPAEVRWRPAVPRQPACV
jgi:hypothetical protein